MQSMRKATRAGVFFFILTLAITSLANDKKTEAQYWEETSLSFDSIAYSPMLKTRNCYRSVQNLKGCLDAVNVIAGATDRRRALVPTALLKKQAVTIVRIEKVYGLFSLVEGAPAKEQKKLSMAEALESAKKAQLELLVVLEQILKNKVQTDFRVIIGDLKPMIRPEISKPMLAGLAINAHLASSKDPHTRLAPLAAFLDDMNEANTTFTGVGLSVSNVDGKTYVQGLISGGPAKAAGVKVGDEIVGVDGVTMTETEKIVAAIRGPAGTPVTIDVLRDNAKISIRIVRKNIEKRNVTGEIVEDLGQKIAYIKVGHFMDQALCKTLSSELMRLQKEGAQGLVLDLRGNGGGLLEEAVCMGGLFVGRKTIAQVRNLDSNAMERKDSSQVAVTSLPMVTLIDAGSASASEVISGALQDYHRSWIVGERSFGKATVQRGKPLPWNGLLSFETIARFYQPSGRTNQLVGILPDIEAPIRPSATQADRAAFREENLPYVLPKLGEPWVQTRPAEANKISTCLKTRNRAVNAYNVSPSVSDYQKLVAQEVLLCAGEVLGDR